MQRRMYLQGMLGAAWGATSSAVLAKQTLLAGLGISASEADSALKLALERGVQFAVTNLGKPDGFGGNPKVRIALPKSMQQVALLMRSLGQGQRVDDLNTAMNRAAEIAVPHAKTLLNKAIKTMRVEDAQKIINGGNTSVTDFFATTTRPALTELFLPIVTQATQKEALAKKYNDFARRGQRLGLIPAEDANLENYVTTKALDGMYLMIGEQERKIRADPLGTGSAILQKVFGKL